MTGPDDPPKSRKNAQNAAREARLAAALRENLKRRKAQIRDKERTRTQASGGTPESDDKG
ncbi:hypothetical protein [Pseudolabrys sp. FHR47]|uniref:hypothetical protein n=1 Tax=Pseudolabrys sp. FHR47 TaxID=2562284 RepID=UPI0010BE76CD|nr:hypothetical protein [Pseudolabrys sp. FHR47]